MKRYIDSEKVVETLKAGGKIYKSKHEILNRRGGTVYASWDVWVEDVSEHRVGYIHPMTLKSLIKREAINSPDNESGTGKYALR